VDAQPAEVAVVKAVNVAVANEFQAWQRRAMPRSCVIQDVDSWLVAVSDPLDPVALVELKRSHVEPASWQPYAADRPNYAALLALAARARLPLLVVYFVKGRPLADGDPLGVFVMTDAVPEYRYAWRDVITARAFALLFEHPNRLAAIAARADHP
jgi:hypothetical protein